MSVAATLAPAAPSTAQDPIRVMIVDDAVVMRGLVSRWIDEEAGLKTVASLRTGREAVDQVLRVNPDVVVLDIEMPDLDGLEALPLLLEKKRDLIVIMASTLTRRNAEVSLKALSLGAADYIPKPASNREVTTSAKRSASSAPAANAVRPTHGAGRPSRRRRPARWRGRD
jgi:two-component system chemotaxis response regulator CheB